MARGKAIGAVPFVGPGGELYVAWNDYKANVIAFNRSFDGGATWERQRTVGSKQIAFDIAIPAESFRGRAGVSELRRRSVQRSTSRPPVLLLDGTSPPRAPPRTSLCPIVITRALSWSTQALVTEQFATPVDRLNQWLSVDSDTGDVNVSFYDTRNDTTGSRYMSEVYLSQSTDGGGSWSANTRISTVSSNEHDCAEIFPCQGIDYRNQYGEYESPVSFSGISHAIWTDSRYQLNSASGCKTNLVR